MGLIKLNPDSAVPKYLQIVESIVAAVRSSELSKGDKLPSLASVARSCDVSINTVVKAYAILKRRGLARTTFGQGFYLTTDSIETNINVFLLFDEINMFKEDLYMSFKEELGQNARIDVFFHHFNPRVFKSLVVDAKDNYSHYVVMPVPGSAASSALAALPSESLLFLDRVWGHNERRFVAQDHQEGTFAALSANADFVKAYSRLRVINPKAAYLDPFYEIILKGAKSFGDASGMEIVTESNPDFSKIERGDLYLTISERDLASFVLSAREKGLRLGKDVGLVAYNDTSVRELMDVGIATISTDYKEMGRSAAKRILDPSLPSEFIPTRLKIRPSIMKN